ncbi:MAG: aldolase/citrate lyase family protein [Burkholderiaceae bacterium]
MKLTANPFLSALRRGERQVGLWVSLSSGFAADVVATSGFDWVLLDMEHSPGDIATVQSQLQVFAGVPTTAIVRPDWNDTVKIKRLLDMGAPGLLLPMVQSADEARRAVAACRYPPRGVRGVSGSTRANAFGRVSDYFARVEDETAILVQLETRAAVGQAAQIAAVDGVSGVFFGPADIAADIGLLGKPMDPAVWDLILPAARSLMEAGMPVGTLVQDAAFATRLLNEGFSFVACGSDTGLLARAADALLATVKDKLT